MQRPGFVRGSPLRPARAAEQFWRGIPAARGPDPPAQHIWRQPAQVMPGIADMQPPHWLNQNPPAELELPASSASSSGPTSSASSSANSEEFSLLSSSDMSEHSGSETGAETHDGLDEDEADVFLEVDHDVGPEFENVGVQADIEPEFSVTELVQLIAGLIGALVLLQ